MSEGRFSTLVLGGEGHTVEAHYLSVVRALADTLSLCTIPLPRVVTRDQTVADLFLRSAVLCLTASAMEKFPLSLSSAVMLKQGKQANEMKG